MKIGQIKKLNFINDKNLISSILNEQLLEMSSLQSSLTSSGLNFSTFRSEDFPSFHSTHKISSPSKSIKLCKISTQGTVHNLRELCFRNSSELVNKILHRNNKINEEVQIFKESKKGIKKLNFRTSNKVVNQILNK